MKCIDLRIGEIQKIIENKRKQITNLNMERLDNINNPKFNIMVNQNQHNDGIPYRSPLVPQHLHSLIFIL